MKHLKPVQILTDDAIYLLKRVKIVLETYNDVLPSNKTENILKEFEELIEEVKN